MFLLHERTRKSFCRLGFILLCALPTGAVGLWAAVRKSDPHRVACEADVSNLLLLDAAIGGVEHPEPGVVRYTNLELSDPETNGPIARAAILEARTSKGATTISASHFTIEISGAGTLGGLLHSRLRDRTTGGEPPVRIAIGELIIASPSGDVSLLDVRGRLEPTSEGRGAQFTFRTSAMPKDAKPAVLTIVRSRHTQSGFELTTHGAFQEPTGAFGPALQLLRALVTDHLNLVPVTPEAEELLRMPPT
jgi:hypothetical protein